MALPQESRATFQSLVNSGNIRYVTYPAAAASVAMVSDGAAAAWAWAAYVTIVAAGVIADPCWLCGVSIHTPAVETHNGDIAIASGAAAAEVDLAIWHYKGTWPVVGTTAALVADAVPREVYSNTIWLPYPIRIAAAPRLAGKVRKSTAASAAGVSLKVIAVTGVGT